MYKFSSRSKKRLDTCHADIMKVMDEAIKHCDFSVLEGHRTEEKQELYYERGTSKLHYPMSRHNRFPSEAIDIIPYPFNGWEDLEQFEKLATEIFAAAEAVGVELTWGGNWRTFKDYPQLATKINSTNCRIRRMICLIKKAFISRPSNLSAIKGSAIIGISIFLAVLVFFHCSS